MKCTFCGQENNPTSKFCTECGRELPATQQQYTQPYTNNSAVPVYMTSPCNKWIAFLLCLFLGCIGIHRFYVGKIGTGIVYILTFGWFGIGVLVDLIMIVCGKFTDKSGAMLID